MSTLLANASSSGFVSGTDDPDDNNQDHHQHHHGLHQLPDLNGVDLVMNLSPKSNSNHNSNTTTSNSTTNLSDHQLHDQLHASAVHHNHLSQHHLHHQDSLSQQLHHHHLHHHHHHHQSLTNLQHLQSLQSHSTPFSVTDILSPIEESYRKELSGGDTGDIGAVAVSGSGSGVVTINNQPSPYR